MGRFLSLLRSNTTCTVDIYLEDLTADIVFLLQEYDVSESDHRLFIMAGNASISLDTEKDVTPLDDDVFICETDHHQIIFSFVE